MTGVFRHTDTEASHVTTVAEIGAMLPQAKDTWGHQRLEEAGRILTWGPQRETNLLSP